MQQTKNLQHFVPRSYLRAFADPDGQLLAILRDPYEVRSVNVATVAAERWFYKLRREDGTLSDELEDALATLDSQIPEIVARVTGRGKVERADLERLRRLYAVIVCRGHVGRDFILEEVKDTRARVEQDYGREFPGDDDGTRQKFVDLVLRRHFDHPDDMATDPETMSRANILRLTDQLLRELPTNVCIIESQAHDFCTSDAPFSAFNPQNPPTGDGRYDPDMSSPLVELTLPITSRHLALFANRPMPKKAKGNDGVVRIANARTMFFSKRMIFAYPHTDALANAMLLAEVQTYRNALDVPLLSGLTPVESTP